uniref:Uncharacterized protein n=1 Tax=Arion vulgaris TaxID=1028688 RepID=A0A0B7ACX6_9EUPU
MITSDKIDKHPFDKIDDKHPFDKKDDKCPFDKIDDEHPVGAADSKVDNTALITTCHGNSAV